jgi:small subunit ribosomal protein S16
LLDGNLGEKGKKSIFAALKKWDELPLNNYTMAVKIRLARRGRKKLAKYDVVVADARSPRDGKFIEKLGTYNPLTVPATIDLDDEKAFQWLMNGAQPSDTVKAMLSYRGVMLRKHLQIGVVKGAVTQEVADAKLAAWTKEKESKIQAKRDSVSKTKVDSAKARKEAETKVKEARAEAIRKKAEVAAAVPVVAETPAEAGEAAPAENTEA